MNGLGAAVPARPIGQTLPYSGPALAYSVIGRTLLAYFKMLNEQDGVNGRKISFISLDDGLQPRRARDPRISRVVSQLGVPPRQSFQPMASAEDGCSR